MNMYLSLSHYLDLILKDSVKSAVRVLNNEEQPDIPRPHYTGNFNNFCKLLQQNHCSCEKNHCFVYDIKTIAQQN